MDNIKEYLTQNGIWDKAKFQTINAWIARFIQQLLLADVISKI